MTRSLEVKIMTRIACLGLATIIGMTLPARADDESVLGKTRSQWLELLKSGKQTKLRRAALIALEVLGPKTAGVTDGIIEALDKDADAEVRRDAAQTLARMGADAKGAVDALADALKKDKDGSVREASARGLGRLAAQVDTQTFILAGALTDADAGTRAAAAETLNALGDKARIALPQLLKVLADKKADAIPREYAARIMGRLDSETKTTVPALAAVCVDKQAPLKVRETAVDALARLGTAAEETAEPLARIVQAKDEKPALRRSAVVALGKIGIKAALGWPALQNALRDNDNGLRYQAIRLAGALAKDDKAIVPALADSALKDENVENRLAAIQELGQLGNLAVAAVPTLNQLTSDSRGSIRNAAQDALKKIK
jgi:HEAT repeat protein